MRGLEASGWLLSACGWFMVVAMPFRVSPETAMLAVVFPPWVAEREKIDALVAADLFIIERRGPMTMIAFAPDGGADTAALRRHGALFVFGREGLALCRSERVNPPYAGAVPGEI